MIYPPSASRACVYPADKTASSQLFVSEFIYSNRAGFQRISPRGSRKDFALKRETENPCRHKRIAPPQAQNAVMAKRIPQIALRLLYHKEDISGCIFFARLIK